MTDQHPGLIELDNIASTETDGCLRVEKLIVNSEGHHMIQWAMAHGSDESPSFYLFVNPASSYPESLDACIGRELDQIKERIEMDIYGTELFPYIAGEMLAGKGSVTLTIKDVRNEELRSSRGADQKPVVYFKERDKGLVLNKTNAKQIARLYGRETNDWRGKKISIYAQEGEWFGEKGYAIRIADTIPQNGRGRPAPQQETAHDDDQDEQLVYMNGTKVKMDDAGEVEAFKIYIEEEQTIPPSRAELERWRS